MFLYGKNLVLERLKVNPKSIKEIFLQDNFNEPYIENLAKENKIPLKRLPQKQLYKIKYAPHTQKGIAEYTENLQGIIANVDDFKYTAFDDLLSQEPEKKIVPIFLDRIFDPQNLGAIIRTTACFGGFALVIPKYKACEVTETVLRVAQGGENYVPVSMVSNISNAIIAAKKNGFWIVGAVIAEDSQDIDKVSLPFPLGLVLGSEGKGVRYGVDKHLDIKVHIPMQGAKLSFNVAVACALFCHAINRQKQ